MRKTELERAEAYMEAAYNRMVKAAKRAVAATSYHAAAELDYTEAWQRVRDLQASTEAREGRGDGE